eukprot:5272461-Amphidinium_carterae.1
MRRTGAAGSRCSPLHGVTTWIAFVWCGFFSHDGIRSAAWAQEVGDMILRTSSIGAPRPGLHSPFRLKSSQVSSCRDLWEGALITSDAEPS